MSDEKPVPETLESIGQQIRDLTTLTKSFVERFNGIDQRFDGIDQRFDGIDQRFAAIDQRFAAIDKRFDELKAQLRAEIESVRDSVGLVAEGFAAQALAAKRNEADHELFRKQIEKHDLRITALEPKELRQT